MGTRIEVWLFIRSTKNVQGRIQPLQLWLLGIILLFQAGCESICSTFPRRHIKKLGYLLGAIIICRNKDCKSARCSDNMLIYFNNLTIYEGSTKTSQSHTDHKHVTMLLLLAQITALLQSCRLTQTIHTSRYANPDMYTPGMNSMPIILYRGLANRS